MSHMFPVTLHHEWAWKKDGDNSVRQSRKYYAYFLSALLESHALNLTAEAPNFQLPSQNCGLQHSSGRPH